MKKIPFLRYPQKEQKLIVSMDDGGLGDNIARLPVINYMLEKFPHLNITLVCHKYFVSFAKRSLPKSKKLSIKHFDEIDKLNKTTPVKSFARVPYSNLSTHLTDHSFRVIAISDGTPEYKNYLPVNTKSINIERFELPEKYVVITTGFTADVREMKPEIVNGIADHIIKKGYTPVFLGKKETYAGNGFAIKGEFSDEIQFDKGIDLRDQTTLLETVCIIKEAKTIVGLDNGLLHVAGTTDIPIVGGFTTVDPNHRMPYRNNVMGWNYYPVVIEEEELPCRFCQSNMVFTFKHDFRNCYYKDKKCLDLLSVDKYTKKLDLIL